MDGSIVFYIHSDTIEYDSVLFSAGELTADILNLTAEDHRSFDKRLQRIWDLAEQYEDTLDRGVWWELNCQFITLRRKLMGYRVFQILLRDDERLLNEAAQYTEALSLLPEEELDLTDHTLEQWTDLLERAELSGDIPFPLLICHGSRKEKWNYYRQQILRYEAYLKDVAAFNPTIHNFIRFLLAKLERNSPENYAAALYQFYNDERLAEKLIVNPASLDQSFYRKYDPCAVSYVPRELPDGTFAICQEHTTDSLQALLKADYMTALNAGYNIRQCAICKKYFLVKSGAHALYCEGACPHAPQYTCRQFGSYTAQKELAGDIPKVRMKLAAFERIRKDRLRGIITAEEAKTLNRYVADLLYRALGEADFSNERFEEMVSPSRLYADCGVTRKARPRGRPRKVKDGDAP